jgi:hypothetical protein
VRLKRKAFANHELNDCLKSWNSMNDKIQSLAKKSTGTKYTLPI